MSRHEVVIDPWTFFDFKEQMQGNMRLGRGRLIPSWVPDDDFRRLTAYKIQDSYLRNAAREWLKDDTPDEVRESRREYGDPKTIRDAILSSLLGDDMSFLVTGAEDTNPDSNDSESQAFAEELSKWRIDERFDQKVIECERNAVGLADGVYTLHWDADRSRPRLTVYDPGFYFPDLDPTTNQEYPDTICIAWEYEVETDSGTKKYLRRLKWYMGLITTHDEDGYEVSEDDEASVLFSNETVDAEGQILRQYPWNPKPIPTTCYFSDMTWDLSDTNSEGLFDLSGEGVFKQDQPEIDLQMDYIPVIHIPNSVAGAEHFGTGCLAQIAQILDDLVATDTDLQASSATTGTPPIALSGSSAPKDEDGNVKSYGPGTVFETGDGTATVIDTSRSLDALLKYKDALQERLATNSRVPESLLGKVKPNEVPSGIALTLSFTPHSQLIKEMRLVRADKYRLLLKMIGRMFWYNDVLTFTDNVPRVEMVFGSFLPADQQAVVSLITSLIGTQPPLISLETGVRMLMESGMPIEDAEEEIKRIQAQNFEGANRLLEATGDIVATRTYLGLGPPPEPPQPPPAPPGPPTPPEPGT